jgi:hypothetical protein
MRPSFRIAITLAALLFLASEGDAQIRGGFGQRQTTVFQVRNGPFSSFTFASSGYSYGFGPIYGPVPSWYYGWPGYSIINNPYNVQPPVVIQNIINAPPAVAAAPARPPVVPAEVEAPKPVPKAGKPKAAPAPPPLLILPEPPKAPNALGRADADRIAEAGRKAFADGQYGRALELFRRAAEITPNEPSAHYLVSQALFALGKYREAVAAIATGISTRADWSDARFASRDLYWKKPEVFDDHLKALRQAVAEFPQDATPIFLLGHQFWFDGKKEEAKALILKARQLGKDQTPAETFRVDAR